MCDSTTFTDSELNRYERQTRLAEVGIEGQEKLKRSSVVVVGAGALGCPVLQYLAAAGVGTIGIVDNDSVDETNLHRQVLYGVRDLNKPKPIAARDRLLSNNPGITVKAHYIRLNKENALSILGDYGVTLDCTDNFATRYLINDAAILLNKPVIYGAIHRFSGQVMVLNYKEGPTLRCIFPSPPHPLEIPSCENEGSIGSIAGTIGSLQAGEAIKVILGLDGILSGKMFFIDSLNFSSQIFTFKRDPVNSSINELGTYDDLRYAEMSRVNELTSKQFKKMLLEKPHLKVIDLRDDKEKKDIGFETLPIPFNEINQKLDLIPGTGPKVFYCGHGIKSSLVVNYLQKVHHMDELYSLIM